MQRIIQINIAGRILPIEEDAYTLLSDYIKSLKRQFTGEEGKEIIEDIEHRISELFSLKLESGAQAIDRTDVQNVISTLGAASDLSGDAGSSDSKSSGYNTGGGYSSSNYTRPRQPKLLRNTYDKVIGGVCSGMANYFDIDPVIIRLIMAVLFFTLGIGFIAYIIAWAIIPAAKSPDDLLYMTDGSPASINDITRNMNEELQDLKRRAEQMSRDLASVFRAKGRR
jgi:phage shock protein PspC (stress-responsive transcriptional regulator)